MPLGALLRLTVIRFVVVTPQPKEDHIMRRNQDHFSQFNRDFDRSRRRFNIFFTVVSSVIVLMFVAMIAFYVFVGTVAVSVADDVKTDGVRAVIERLWCGPNNKCL